MEQIQQSSPRAKKCPFCAEEILIDAKKCRYCGEFLEANSPKDNKDAHWRTLAICGSLLLLVSLFAPFVSAPIVGRITLLGQGKGDGVILLFVSLIALIASFFRLYGFLWISGLLGLLEIGNLFNFFYSRLPVLIENYKRKTMGNPFGSIGAMTISNVNPDWGAIVLLLGTLMSLGVAFRTGINWRALVFSGLGVCALIIGYLILLLYFPSLQYKP